MLQVADALSLETTIEGIEDEDQLQQVRALGFCGARASCCPGRWTRRRPPPARPAGHRIRLSARIATLRSVPVTADDLQIHPVRWTIPTPSR